MAHEAVAVQRFASHLGGLASPGAEFGPLHSAELYEPLASGFGRSEFPGSRGKLLGVAGYS
jgi:hypothetical protein